MVDRLKGAVVTFEHDIREEDVESLLQAIRMIRGVASVTPSLADRADHWARERVKHELRAKLHRTIEAAFNGDRPEEDR